MNTGAERSGSSDAMTPAKRRLILLVGGPIVASGRWAVTWAS